MEVVLAETPLGRGVRIDITIANPSSSPEAAGDVEIPLERFGLSRAAQVLEHGWQSWSPVRRCSPSEVVPERSSIPGWASGTYLADAEGAGRVVTGDQFLVCDAGVAGWLDGREALGMVRVSSDGALSAVALIDEVELAAGEERRLDPLWVAAGEPGALYSEYASLWGSVAGARVGAAAPLGWCSWYEYFPDVTPAAMRANLALAAEHGFGLVQLDDGYQRAIGDWLDPRPGWEEGIGSIASDIRGAGVAAGLWTAPFIVGENSRVFAEHPEWTVRHASGRPARAVFNDANWGGWTFALDLTQPAVLDWLRSTYAALRAEGFEYHKIDFCFAGALAGTRADRTRTRAQALRAGLEAVRAGIGDDAFLLGCGCPFGQAVGVVDAMRVSADVAPTWEPAIYWAGFPESAPAAANSIAASVLRSPLHRRVWINDPDCALLRPTNTSLTARQRRAVADMVAGTGGFTVVSDDLSRYGRAQRDELARLRRLSVAGDAPLDIADPFARTVTVESPALRLEVTWPALGLRIVDRNAPVR